MNEGKMVRTNGNTVSSTMNWIERSDGKEEQEEGPGRFNCYYYFYNFSFRWEM